MNYFRDKKIIHYVYEFRHLGYILKYGFSMGAAGERVYRQAANIPLGWSKSFRSPSGKDFQCVCEDFFNKYGVIVNKNNVTLVIHDMSGYPFEIALAPELEIRRFEAELIAAFVELHGELPIGNLKLEENSLYISATPDAVMNQFFKIAA
jgi:hypothetical protein